MSDFGCGKQREGNDRRGNARNEHGKMESRDKSQETRTMIFKRLDSIQDPGKRYALKDRIGDGVHGNVYEGIDQEAGKVYIYVDE